MADKDLDSKLDKIAEHMGKIHDGVEQMRENHKALAARMDKLEKRDAALPTETEEEREAADRVRRDGESEDSYAKRIEALDARKRDREREMEDRERRDRAKRRLDAEERERQERADGEAGVRAQLRADKAYQAWNLGQAPHRAHGEQLRDFEIRLLRPLKQYSPRYRDSSLETIGDATVFADVADRVIADAVEASISTVVEGAPLRRVTERNENGHTITKWYGDPAVCWSPFMGGAIRIAKLRRPDAK
jgi:hypothetical protein